MRWMNLKVLERLSTYSVITSQSYLATSPFLSHFARFLRSVSLAHCLILSIKVYPFCRRRVYCVGAGGKGQSASEEGKQFPSLELQESKQTEDAGEGPKEEQDYGTLVITSTALSRVERLTSGSGSFGRRTTLSSSSYMRHPETQSTTTTRENGYPSSGVGRSRQPDAHSRTMSTPRTRKPSASAAGGEDASSAVEHHPTHFSYLAATHKWTCSSRLMIYRRRTILQLRFSIGYC